MAPILPIRRAGARVRRHRQATAHLAAMAPAPYFRHIQVPLPGKQMEAPRTLKRTLLASLAILSLALPVTSGALVILCASPAFAKGDNGKGGSERSRRSERGGSARDKDTKASATREQSGKSSGTENGNTNGPLGALAGLAVADHDANGAQELIDTTAGFEALDTALAAAGYNSLEAYLDAGETDTAVDDALTALDPATQAIIDGLKC